MPTIAESASVTKINSGGGSGSQTFPCLHEFVRRDGERQANFDAVAEARYAGIVASGKTIPWQEMRGYLEARMAGKTARKPVARKLAR